jgi:hypothetical protein
MASSHEPFDDHTAVSEEGHEARRRLLQEATEQAAQVREAVRRLDETRASLARFVAAERFRQQRLEVGRVRRPAAVLVAARAGRRR